MIHVVAVITAKAGQRGQLLEAFAANRAAVLAEAGCIEYAATIDAQGIPTSKELVESKLIHVLEPV
jgi:quinol monooxygenase YgiN